MTDFEAREVLIEVRARVGRRWRSLIRDAWMDGDYMGRGLGSWAARLQNIRNQLGPTWLARQQGPWE